MCTYRGDVHDMPVTLATHRRQYSGNAMQHTAYVDIDHPIPFIDLQSRERGQRHDARVVDDDIEAPKSRNGMVSEGLYLRTLGYIHLFGLCHPACALNVSHDMVQFFHTARAQQYGGAVGGQKPCGGFADTTAGASNQNHFIESLVHRETFCVQSPLCMEARTVCRFFCEEKCPNNDQIG